MQQGLGVDGIKIEIMLMGNVYSNSSITYFDIKLDMNSVPTGTIEVYHTGNPNVKIQSGEIGIMKFSSTEHTELNDSVFKFIVNQSYMDNSAAGNDDKIIISYILGTISTFETKTLQLDGTSTDMMKYIFKEFGYNNAKNEISNKVMGDKMNWICIRNNMEGMLSEVVSHSFLEGDYVFYNFSTTLGNYRISSFNASMESKNKNMITFSPNSYSSSDSASYTDDTTGYTVWQFNSLKKSNNIGNQLQNVYPNLLYSTYHEGKPDVGECNEQCFSKLLSASGYDKQDEITRSLGGATSYGPSIMIKDYPLNTGNMYSVAPILRNRILAIYSKKVDLILINSIGPDVGDYVSVRVKSNEKEINLTTLDDVYSDNYIVLSKYISKAKAKTNNDDVYTYITLGSPNLTSGNAQYVADEFAKIKFPNN